MKLHQIALTITISVLSALSTQTVASNTAHSEIQVVGLFKDAAIISMHHQQQMMRVGDEKHDVRLLAANSQNALVEYHGKRMLLGMAETAAIQVGLPEPTHAQAHLIASGDMYNVTGSINDQLADFSFNPWAHLHGQKDRHRQVQSRAKLDRGSPRRLDS